jgi:hypothetical protein
MAKMDAIEISERYGRAPVGLREVLPAVDNLEGHFGAPGQTRGVDGDAPREFAAGFNWFAGDGEGFTRPGTR